MPFSIIGATRWFPRTPCSYDQRGVSEEPPSGSVDAESSFIDTKVRTLVFAFRWSAVAARAHTPPTRFRGILREGPYVY